MSDHSNIRKRASTARRKAELSATSELLAWHKIEATKIDEDPELGEIAREAARRDLLMEFGRRSSRALSKAKRDNTVVKTLEKDIRAEIHAEKNQRGTT